MGIVFSSFKVFPPRVFGRKTDVLLTGCMEKARSADCCASFTFLEIIEVVIFDVF
jgi:hypothetical protein